MSGHIERITALIRRSAELSISLNDLRWCELISASFPDNFGEVEQAICVSATGVLTEKRGEIVRFYLNLNDPVSRAVVLDAIRMALDPFVVCGRQLAMHDFEEGIVFFLTENGKIERRFHADSPHYEIDGVAL